LHEPVGFGAELAPETSPSQATTSPPGHSTKAPPNGDAQPVRFDDAAEFSAVSTPGNSAYLIGPQDVLEVSVFRVPDLSRSFQVADAGTINVPLIGEVHAAGKTVRELENDLAHKLGASYLQSPQVTVFVKEHNSRRVTVEGAVKKPGVYPIRGPTTLLQYISMAEGVTEASDTADILVFRSAAGRRSAAKFNLDEIRAGRAADPEMQDGDVIVVNSSAAKAAFQNLLRILPSAHAFVPLL
jgi:polysaccharide export outer membrane protein